MQQDTAAYKLMRWYTKGLQVINHTASLILGKLDLHAGRAILDSTKSGKIPGRVVKWSPEDIELMNMFSGIMVPGKSLLRSMEYVIMAVSGTLYDSLHIATKQEQQKRDLRRNDIY